MTETQGSQDISTKLERIAKLAKEKRGVSLLTLAHHIDLDWLREAYRRTRKGGAPGVDGQSAEEYEARLEDNLRSLLDRAKSGQYRAPPVRRVHIPKGDGTETRPIGIPTFEDKVLQRAVAMVIGEVYEQEFYDCSYGFRPGRSAHDALQAVQNAAWRMRGGWVVEVDIRKFFDTVDHTHLRAILRQRIGDGVLLRLIGKWLNAGVREGFDLSYPDEGTPQGGVISPLLANSFLHWFDKAFHMPGGPSEWAKARLVRYADDFVVLARYQGASLRQWIESFLETRMGLTINREKTSTVKLREVGRLDFLGFTLWYAPDLHGRGHRYLRMEPSKKARARERDKLRELTDKRMCFMPVPMLIERINRHLRGWANYFDHGYARPALREINNFVRERITKHLRRRSQRPFVPPEGLTYYAHLKRMGLIYL